MTEPLFLTDKEIAARLGVGADDWAAIVRTLERSGLPEPDPLFGRRRYWPAVKAFLDARSGLGTPSTGKAGFQPDGREDFEHVNRRTRTRAPQTA